MPKKRSNGEGSVTYDSRRKRYRAKVTVGWELNEETGKSKQITKTIGSNYKTKGEAAAALAEYFKDPYDVDKKNISDDRWNGEKESSQYDFYISPKLFWEYTGIVYKQT